MIHKEDERHFLCDVGVRIALLELGNFHYPVHTHLSITICRLTFPIESLVGSVIASGF